MLSLTTLGDNSLVGYLLFARSMKEITNSFHHSLFDIYTVALLWSSLTTYHNHPAQLIELPLALGPRIVNIHSLCLSIELKDFFALLAWANAS